MGGENDGFFSHRNDNQMNAHRFRSDIRLRAYICVNTDVPFKGIDCFSPITERFYLRRKTNINVTVHIFTSAIRFLGHRFSNYKFFQSI